MGRADRPHAGRDPGRRQAAPATIIPIDQEVIDSEQEMADTFYDNGLLPEKVDVADYFSDAFNKTTTSQTAEK